MTVVIRADRVLPNSKDDLISDGVVVIEGRRIVWDPDTGTLRLPSRNASKLLDAGVTSCRDLGSRGLTTASIRDQISRGKLAGPRIQCANAPLTVPGGHAALMGGSIDRAADAHFDRIEHCAWINPDSKAEFDPVVAQKFVDGNIAVCPTMNTACISQCYFCPWDERPAIVDNLRKMREIGIRLVTGTDSGIGLCRFERYADGLTVLADVGYTSREIIAASTEAAAEVCGLERETVRLEAGFAADLAAFAGNPLENVTAYGEPRFVMALGREYELSPIEPLRDIKEKADLTLKLLREGAGIKK
ncbi:hypothetical protein SUNI508_10419 [Seiridium unicorne]|uniref:Amidohydrolase-related domain-containing protein n=1 Tax=Seiridium unicorne TaxID=138068 RepID=A0ABR2ULR5_9PEZI